MIVNIVANTNGKGLWTKDARPVLINKIEFGYTSIEYYPEDPVNGELRAYFDPSGFGHGSWNVRAFGLVYTDKLWLREFKKGLRSLGFSIKAVQNLNYSEQGMQGEDFVSMDFGPAFYASWKRLVKLQKS